MKYRAPLCALAREKRNEKKKVIKLHFSTLISFSLNRCCPSCSRCCCFLITGPRPTLSSREAKVPRVGGNSPEAESRNGE